MKDSGFNGKKSNLVARHGIDSARVYSAFTKEDLYDIIDGKWDTHLKEDSILDCCTSDMRLKVDEHEQLKHKFSRIVSCNMFIDDPTHVVWDWKFHQMRFYNENRRFFNEYNSYTQKFLRFKGYLFLTNHIRFERIEIFNHLCNEKLLDNGFISFPKLENTLQYEESYALTPEQRAIYKEYDKDFLPIYLDFLPKESWVTEKKHKEWNKEKKEWVDVMDYGERFNPKLYENVYFEVLSETYYYTLYENSKEGRPDVNHISEKTLKPIINLVPHLCLAHRDYYKLLHKHFGLTFNSEIFKSISNFDSMEAGEEKTRVFIESIDYLLRMDRQSLHELYINAYPELLRNQRKVFDYFKDESLMRRLND